MQIDLYDVKIVLLQKTQKTTMLVQNIPQDLSRQAPLKEEILEALSELEYKFTLLKNDPILCVT